MGSFARLLWWSLASPPPFSSLVPCSPWTWTSPTPGSASRCRSTGVSKKRHNPFHRANSVSRATGALEGRPPVSSRGKRVGFPEETCPADPGGEAGQGRLVLASVPSGSCLRVMSSHGFGSALPSSLPSLLRLFSRGFASFLRHFQDHK